MGIDKKFINNILYKIVVFLINFYQKIISPMLPARCRYYPTCSNYGKQALAWHGVGTGSWLLIKRLGRCQPWGGHGIDFVPVPLNLYRYEFVSSNKNLGDGRPLPLISNIDSYQSSSVYRDNSSYVARLNYLISQS